MKTIFAWLLAVRDIVRGGVSIPGASDGANEKPPSVPKPTGK